MGGWNRGHSLNVCVCTCPLFSTMCRPFLFLFITFWSFTIYRLYVVNYCTLRNEIDDADDDDTIPVILVNSINIINEILMVNQERWFTFEWICNFLWLFSGVGIVYCKNNCDFNWFTSDLFISVLQTV